MTRPIKFRAWNQMDRKWEQSACIHSDGSVYRHYLLASNLASVGSLVIQQFTGRLDRNGVEIYEGDWVRCEQRGDSIIVSQGDVMYHEDELAWVLRQSSGGYDLLTRYTNFEVIGNIYEGDCRAYAKAMDSEVRI